MVRQFKSIEEVRDYILNNGNVKVNMMLGNGDKKQYKDINELKKSIKDATPDLLMEKQVFLYFGDVPNEKNPDIGYAFKYLSELYPNDTIIMIQIKEMEKYGVPDFVKCVFFHSDYDEKNKWGGFEKDENGKYQVYSNTKQWLNLHWLLYEKRFIKYDENKQIRGISNCFVFGEGGDITKQELHLIKKLKELEDKHNDKHIGFGIELKKYDLESRYEIQSKYWKDKTKI